MNAALDIGIEGIGVWSPELTCWPEAKNILCGNAEAMADAAARPPAAILPAGERRRAPEPVLAALEAAQQACAMARREPRDLAHVFASAYGDLAINDYLCATLARAPREVSPTKFHNCVHNAPAGYWAIATGCHENSSAVSAGDETFGAGLLEAALLAHGGSHGVLLCVYDVPASGPLRDVIACHSTFAAALVLAPSSPRAIARTTVRVGDDATTLAPVPSLLHACHAGNPAAASLPLLTTLARREPAALRVAAAPSLHLHLEVSF